MCQRQTVLDHFLFPYRVQCNIFDFWALFLLPFGALFHAPLKKSPSAAKGVAAEGLGTGELWTLWNEVNAGYYRVPEFSSCPEIFFLALSRVFLL